MDLFETVGQPGIPGTPPVSDSPVTPESSRDVQSTAAGLRGTGNSLVVAKAPPLPPPLSQSVAACSLAEANMKQTDAESAQLAAEFVLREAELTLTRTEVELKQQEAEWAYREAERGLCDVQAHPGFSDNAAKRPKDLPSTSLRRKTVG